MTGPAAPTLWQSGDDRISTVKSELQLERIHRYLSTEAYWCQGIPIETVRTALERSLCFGVYHREHGASTLWTREHGASTLWTREHGASTLWTQIGLARVVTDGATFAWLCDVYIETAHRGRGLSKQLMASVLAHPDLQGLRRLCLTTRDAHGLYRQFGFEVTAKPGSWMEINDNEIYLSG